MPLFRYEAIDSEGDEKKGTLEAVSREQAASQLREDGLFISHIEEIQEEELSRWHQVQKWLVAFDTVKGGEIVMLFQQIATMMEAGVSLVEAVDLLRRQRFSRKLRWVLKEVRSDLVSGNSFEYALSRHKRTFSPLIVSMAAAGELSGTLDEVLRQVADYLEQQANFKKQVVTAFIYPSIVILMSIVVIGFLVMGVIPKFIPFLKGHAEGMPWATQFLMDLTEWTRANWKYLILWVAGFVASIWVAGRIPAVCYFRDRIILKIPVLGMIFLCAPVIRFSRNLGSMVRAGVPLTEALLTVRDTLGNRAFARTMERMRESVLVGESLSKPLKARGAIFPPIVGDLVRVGEETGAMETMLDLVGRMYEFLLSNYIKRMNALIEPILIGIIAGIVGFVGFALLSGVMAVYSSVSGG